MYRASSRQDMIDTAGVEIYTVGTSYCSVESINHFQRYARLLETQ